MGMTLLFSAPVFANECESVNAFIQLGQSASKCVTAVQANNKEAREILHNYRFCSEVRMIRGAIEKSVDEMPVEQINQCANARQNEYTTAATALQKMYQLELRLK
jgi:hypothetical protein